MRSRRKSLLQSLFSSLLVPGFVVMVISVFIVYHVFKDEYDELLDASLVGKAHLLLEFIETTEKGTGAVERGVANLLDFENDLLDPEERTLFWYLDGAGIIRVQSASVGDMALPPDLADGVSTVQGNRYMVLGSESPRAGTVIVAEPMIERNEAITDVVVGVVVGFGLLGLMFAAASFWAVRRSVAMIAKLSDNIAQKNEYNLSPIDRKNAFVEITPAIDTLDTLMSRLDVVLAAERAFATNAAHELRTPVAISLAHAQRLRAQLSDPTQASSAAEIEAGLKRLVRLIERLLQMSRAQSGLGLNAVAADINPVISLLMNEVQGRRADAGALVLKHPTGQWPSRIDPDALGIILNNLFDNALKYASGPEPTVIDASEPGRVVVSNDCDPLAAADLDAIKQRFIRRATLSDGYGLGLSIVQDLCSQSGCRLEIFSPRPDSTRGFSARVTLPQDGADPARAN
jgi:two-component system OmpR family sensor kinase